MNDGIDIGNFVQHLKSIGKVYTVVDRAYDGRVLPISSIPVGAEDVLALNIVTSQNADFVLGGNYGDYIFTREGDDYIDGKGGNDTLIGGTGNNVVFGGDGNDELEGAGSLYGGSGDDKLYGVRELTALASSNFWTPSRAYDVKLIDGGDGIDSATISFSNYNVSINFDVSASENDINGIIVKNIEQIDFIIKGGNSRIIAGSYDDFINANGYIDGGAGNDAIYGFGTLIGGAGDDTIAGYGSVYGGAGDDNISTSVNYKYPDYNTLGSYDGGDGIDSFSTNLYYANISVNFDLAVATPQVLGAATIQNFERVSIVGGNQADTMAGGEYGDSLRGSFGADILYGRGGDDYLEGSGGRDYLDGGVGDDRMVGGQDDDIYIVDSVADQVIEGGSQFKSNDLVRTALSNYALPDFVEDLKYTGSAAFTGTGNTLDNSIEGGIGNDALFGLVGSDVLRGFAGDDVIAGGAGKDVMYGGYGADRFVFAAGDNGLGGALRDVIKDFEPGIDKIDLTGLGAIATFAIEEVPSGSNNSNFYINIDSNGDGARDMQIQLFNRPLFDDILI